MISGRDGEQVERFRNRLKAWSKAIQKIVDESRSEDLVGVDSALLAEILFDVHLAHVRRWLNDDVPNTADGLAGLMRRVRIILRERESSTSRSNFKRATKGAHAKLLRPTETVPLASQHGTVIGRREFISALWSGGVVWPLAARAQRPHRIPRDGVRAGPCRGCVDGPHNKWDPR